MLNLKLQKRLNPKIMLRSLKYSSQVNKAQAVQTPTRIFPFPLVCKQEMKNKGNWINGLLQHIATLACGKHKLANTRPQFFTLFGP